MFITNFRIRKERKDDKGWNFSLEFQGGSNQNVHKQKYSQVWNVRSLLLVTSLVAQGLSSVLTALHFSSCEKGYESETQTRTGWAAVETVDFQGRCIHSSRALVWVLCWVEKQNRARRQWSTGHGGTFQKNHRSLCGQRNFFSFKLPSVPFFYLHFYAWRLIRCSILKDSFGEIMIKQPKRFRPWGHM